MKVGTLLLRTTIGGVMVGHGAQKLFGVAGGHGLRGTAQFFESLGLRPGIAHAAAAGIAETGGGAGLILGYRTQLSASCVIATMASAIHRVHGKNGWNIQDGGFEYNAVLIAGALAIAETGPGFLSLDALRGKSRSGLIPAAFALAAGAGGAAAAGAAAAFLGGSGSGQGGDAEAPSGSAPTGGGEAPSGSAPAGGHPGSGAAAVGDPGTAAAESSVPSAATDAVTGLGADAGSGTDADSTSTAFTSPASVEPVSGSGSNALLGDALADAGEPNGSGASTGSEDTSEH